MRRPALLALALALPAVFAAGAEARSRSRENNTAKFSDWDGFAFRCLPIPDTQQNRAICEWTAQRLRLAALSIKAPFVDASAPNTNFYLLLKSSGHPFALPISLNILATSGTGPIGVHAELLAGDVYLEGRDDAGNVFGPEQKPRPGNFILWDRAIIVSAAFRNSEIETSVRQSLETYILELVNDFAEGQTAAAETAKR